MNRQETIKVLGVIHAAYPSFFDGRTQIEKESVVNLWQESFSNYDYTIVMQGLQAFIDADTKGFAPVIGQIKKHVRFMTNKSSMNEMEAWSYVSKAIRNGNYAAEEEFEKLPPLVKRAVGRPSNIKEWGLLPANEVETVIQSNFMRSFRTVLQRQEQYDALPETGKQMMNALSEGKALENKSIVTKEKEIEKLYE